MGCEWNSRDAHDKKSSSTLIEEEWNQKTKNKEGSCLAPAREPDAVSTRERKQRGKPCNVFFTKMRFQTLFLAVFPWKFPEISWNFPPKKIDVS